MGTTIFNNEFQLMYRARFYGPIVKRPQDLNPSQWLCQVCRKELDEQGNHAHSCPGARGPQTTRHNVVRDILVSAAIEASLNPIKEPEMTDDLGYASKPGVTRASSGTAVEKVRPDLAINPVGQCFAHRGNTQIVDVSITHPMANTTPFAMGPVVWSTDPKCSKPAQGGRPAGDAAEQQAELKHRLYTDAFQVDKDAVVPFIMESYGYIHADAIKLMRYMALRIFDKVLASNLLARNAALQGTGTNNGTQRIRVVGYGPAYRRLLEKVAVQNQIFNARLMTRYINNCVKGKP